MSFAEQIRDWREFYATVAGLSATLVGLLFVGLGLNPRIIAADGAAGMRVLAAQTFHNLLVLLVIALIALTPDDTGRSLAITLLIIGVQGVVRVVLDLRRARSDPDPQWRALPAVTRYVSPALAYGLCLWLGSDLWDGHSTVLGSIVVVVFLLLMSAASNCWDLLEAIGEAEWGRDTGEGGVNHALDGLPLLRRNRVRRGCRWRRDYLPPLRRDWRPVR